MNNFFSQPSTSKKISRQNDCSSVVPWRNNNVLNTVHDDLLSENVLYKKDAIDKATMWESRCDQSLPAAMEATVALQQAQRHDLLLGGPKGVNVTEKDVQSLFSFGIVRFVNLIVDQPNETLTASADKLKLPRWLIDLRNDICHAKVPSLALLRMGAKVSLKYLETYYWDIELELTPLQKILTDEHAEILELVNNYKTQKMLMRNENKRSADYLKLEAGLHEVINKIRSIAKNKRKFIVEVLVKPGVFLCEKYIKELGYGEEPVSEGIDKQGITYLRDLVESWMPIFEILHSFNLINSFLEKLLFSLTSNTNDLCKKIGSYVVVYFINATKPNGPESYSTFRFKPQWMQINYRRLMYASTKAQNETVFREILKQFEEPEPYAPLVVLFGVVSQSTPKNAKIDTNEVFRPEDLASDIIEAKKQKLNLKKEIIWSNPSYTIDYANLPMGTIFSPELPSEDSANLDEEMEAEESILIDGSDDEPTIEEQIPDENIFQDPDIGDMTYT